MEPPLLVTSGEPPVIRVGVSLGGTEVRGGGGLGTAAALTAVNEFVSRMLNIARLMVIVGFVVQQSWYIHSVDFVIWLARLTGLCVLVVAVLIAVAPEQLFNGMALKRWRWAFEMMYPEAAKWSGDISLGLCAGGVGEVAAAAADDAGAPLLLRLGPGALAGQRLLLRWHGAAKYLSLDCEGYATVASSKFAVALRFCAVGRKDTGAAADLAADTYRLQVDEPASRFHGCWLSFTPMSQLRTGGWLRAYRTDDGASPYKVVVDSSCPRGSCKLLCAWPELSPITQRYCTGFYLAEQLSGVEPFIGHAPDVDAAYLELAPAPPSTAATVVVATVAAPAEPRPRARSAATAEATATPPSSPVSPAGSFTGDRLKAAGL